MNRYSRSLFLQSCKKYQWSLKSQSMSLPYQNAMKLNSKVKYARTKMTTPQNLMERSFSKEVQRDQNSVFLRRFHLLQTIIGSQLTIICLRKTHSQSIKGSLSRSLSKHPKLTNCKVAWLDLRSMMRRSLQRILRRKQKKVVLQIKIKEGDHSIALLLSSLKVCLLVSQRKESLKRSKILMKTRTMIMETSTSRRRSSVMAPLWKRALKASQRERMESLRRETNLKKGCQRIVFLWASVVLKRTKNPIHPNRVKLS